jgi:hypothetical protein
VYRWSDVMYWSRQAMGSWTSAYFLVMIFLSFFLFNLIIVVIIVDYSRSQVSVHVPYGLDFS